MSVAVPAPSAGAVAAAVAAPTEVSAPTSGSCSSAAATPSSTAEDPNLSLPNLPFDRYLAQRRYHHIDTDFPGLQLVNEEPYIFIIRDFASPEECAALVARRTARSRWRLPSVAVACLPGGPDGSALLSKSTAQGA